MANLWMRGLKFPNPTARINVGFIQRGLFPYVPKGDTGEYVNLAEKATNIFTRKPKRGSGGLIQMFSTAATAKANDPQKPPINEGSKPGHNKNDPRGKGTEKAAKDSARSDPKNLHEEAEANNK